MIRGWFDKKEGASSSGSGASGPRIPRHSGGWAALRKRLQAEPGLRIIDSADRIEKVAAALPALAEAGADEIVVDVDWDRADGPEYAFAALSDALR